VSGRTKQDGVTCSASGSGVGRQVIGAEVGLNFDDASGEQLAALAADDKFPQQLSGDYAWIAVEE
jgi:hypothetical protein